MRQPLVPGKGVISSELRALVPIISAQNAGPLLDLMGALLARRGGEVHIVGLVEVPGLRPERVRDIMVQRRRSLLRWMASVNRQGLESRGVVSTELKVSHQLALGIREAVYENDSNLIAIEWPGLDTQRPKQLGAVLEDLTTSPPADLVLVRPRSGSRRMARDGARILVPVRGGPNAALALDIGAGLSAGFGCRLTVLHVYSPAISPATRQREQKAFHELISTLGDLDMTVVERDAPSVSEAIFEETRDYDIVVLGAYAQATDSMPLVRSELAAAVRGLPGAVILVRTLASVAGESTFETGRQRSNTAQMRRTGMG